MAGVLIVEDDIWLGELYTNLFSKAGHSVRWCRDAYDALELIDKLPPSVILLDLFLPWVNGIQLLHELSSHSDLLAIPVALCTNALPKDFTAERLKGYGLFAALDKTQTTPGEILKTVQDAINAQNADLAN